MNFVVILKNFTTMTWNEYLAYFKEIVERGERQPPYDNEDYYQYTKLNKSRTNRWLKQSPLTEATVRFMKDGIKAKQEWIVITEPWCGDAAHLVPVLYLMSELNQNIRFRIQLRDSGSEIDQYLTAGAKSIPILIVRDANGNDLFYWGPRSAQGSELFEKLKNQDASFEEMKLALQEFYNKDAGKGVQQEVVELLKGVY